MGRKKQIPDRWLNYHPMKEALDDARIIPIKCPLPVNRFQSEAMQQHRWTPADAMDSIPNLGLVIDITNKQPSYYDPKEFIQNGIDVLKIPCVGHHVPDDSVFFRLCNAINVFLMRNRRNNRIIALHCTHGINRTGYLICRYLIEHLRYSPQEALNTFALKRGYSIERRNYIEALHRLPPVAVY
ncbi:hypothetical protein TNIN_193741 [Trichonephila inaurata madagascariensis]|uniref:RNA/RNP complex-1-interacting phosphatase n=1 Tax=Trichonephila inaurata madagascariensis TaxID=2747483 RepID=A0A8X7C9E6_9ARAC|nr:hypothetical protein TNIN_193741 [Trichonephila inaurata madagascariensis]